jgi:PBSX family phage terminase large subunit
MRKSTREKFREQTRDKTEKQTLTYTEVMKLLVAGEKPPEQRVVNPTQLKLWQSESFEKAYMGPAGCAKTSTGVAEQLAHLLFEPGSKSLIARQDYNDLLDTTFQRFEEMMARLPGDLIMDRSKSPPMKIWLKPMTWNGMKDKLSMITFKGLKGGLGSFEANMAFVDEAAECDMRAVKEIVGRLRWPIGHRFVTLAFNPPPKNHWLYQACTGMNENDEYVGGKTYELFLPQPDENAANLPPDYYQKMMDAMPEDQIQRLVRGEWGSTPPGAPVIKQFNKAIHTAVGLVFEGNTLFRFWDFGFNRPCVLFAMLDRFGRLRILREFLGHKMEGQPFIARVKELTREWFPGATQFRDFGDPAVKQKKDTGSMLTLLTQGGIQLGFQHTPFDVSLSAMRTRFEKLMEREPAILIDRRCSILIGGLEGGYCFKPDGVTPRKDGYYDHLVDALRYGLWNIYGATTNFGFNPYLLSQYGIQTSDMTPQSTSTAPQGISMAYWDHNQGDRNE